MHGGVSDVEDLLDNSGIVELSFILLQTVRTKCCTLVEFKGSPSTYDHRVWRTGLPVRSAVLKPHAGKLVVRWVTTSESLLLYVFLGFPFCLQIYLSSFPSCLASTKD